MLIKVPGFQIIRASAIIDYAPAVLPQIVDVTVRADVGGNLNNKYFHIWAANNSTAYTVWFNVDAGGTDPFIPHTTSIEVAISADDTAASIADAVGVAIAAVSGDFAAATATGTNETVRIENADDGGAAWPSSAWAHTVQDKELFDPGFTYAMIQTGIAFSMPTNLPMVEITGKVKSQKAFHHGPIRRLNNAHDGSGILIESDFDWYDIVLIVPAHNVQYMREL